MDVCWWKLLLILAIVLLKHCETGWMIACRILGGTCEERNQTRAFNTVFAVAKRCSLATLGVMTSNEVSYWILEEKLGVHMDSNYNI